MYDIAVIGGGVIGGAVLRELTVYDVKVVMLEKESDVCMGASKANSGIVHAGFDAKTGTLKARFNVLGNKMMKKYAKDLGVKYKNNGSLVVAFSEEERETLKELKLRGKQNGVKGLKIISEKKLRVLEPSVTDTAVCALYAKTGGIVCPYELTIASIGNAMDNGADLLTDFKVVRAEKRSGWFNIFSENGKCVSAKTVINCAGAGCAEVSEIFGDDSVKIGYRKGEYILCDKERGGTVKRTLFVTPTVKGKGVLVTQTVDGNLLLGPTAEETDNPTTEVTAFGITEIIAKASKIINRVPVADTITSFAGVRTYSQTHDFIVEKSKSAEGLINVCGIESPGLTSAPAIARYVAEELIPAEYRKHYNLRFNGKRKPYNAFSELSERKKNKLIGKDPAFGRVVCRCEKVTEGEIVEAIRRNPQAKTVDAVKRRTRSGMGRCQGGFCQPRVAEILSRELGISLTEITKNGKGSEILTGKNK